MKNIKNIIYYAVNESHLKNLDFLYKNILKNNNFSIKLIYEKELNLINFQSEIDLEF